MIAMDQAGYYGDSVNIIDFKIYVEYEDECILVYVAPHEHTESIISHLLASGQSIETAEIFLALKHGDLEDVCNEM